MNIQWLCSLAFLSAFVLSETPLSASPPDETVQKDAEDIFSRPEFSRLQKLRRADLVREDLSQSDARSRARDAAENRRADRENGGDRRDDPADPRENDNNGDRNQNPPNKNDNPPQNSSSSSSTSFGDFGAGMAGVFKLLGWLAITVMVVVIVLMVIKSIQDRESRLDQELTGTFQSDVGELEADHPPSEYPSDEYLRRAAEFARTGAYREAVAFVLLGAMSEVETRGFIRYRKGLTQRDYYRTVRRHDTLGPAYRNLLNLYEPLGFGRRTAELKHYQTAVNSFQGGFRERAAISEV
jgi:hypothetical protein